MINNKKWGDIFSKSKEEKHAINENGVAHDENCEESPENQNNNEMLDLQKAIVELQEKEKKLLYVLAEKENHINLLKQDMVFDKEAFAIKFIRTISKELDDLFRIMHVMTEKNKDDPLISALKVNCDKFIVALEKINIKVILPKIGDDFDDKFHNAITQIKDENLKNGKVAQVASACYILGEKVITHAMVVVVNND